MARDTPARVRTTTDLERAAAGAAFVIEAAPEDLPTKQELFAELDRFAPAEAVLATNSSSFTLAEVTKRVSERRRRLVVGSHFFLPAQIVPLVEVSRGAGTADEAFEATHALWERCGKTPIRVRRDVSGYVANRLQRALMREALAQVAEGSASAEDIDRAVRFGFGLRFLVRGPLAQRDVAGLGLASRIQTNPDDRERLDAGRRHLLDLAAAGHLGLDTGRGLLDWHRRRPRGSTPHRRRIPRPRRRHSRRNQTGRKRIAVTARIVRATSPPADTRWSDRTDAANLCMEACPEPPPAARP